MDTTVYIGFCEYGYSGQSEFGDRPILTDLRQYKKCDLLFSDLKFWPLYSEIATVEVVIPNGLEQK